MEIGGKRCEAMTLFLLNANVGVTRLGDDRVAGLNTVTSLFFVCLFVCFPGSLHCQSHPETTAAPERPGLPAGFAAGLWWFFES